MRISRKDKKKLRAIILCHTGNPEERKSKYSKQHWIFLKNHYIIWFKIMNMYDRKEANSIKL